MANFVKCGNGLVVNRDEVASIEWDRRHYMSGGGTTHLIITMKHGGKHMIEHRNYVYDPVDCYKIEKALLDARDTD